MARVPLIVSTLVFATVAGASSSILISQAARAQQAGYGQTLGTTPQERELYNDGAGSGRSGAGGSVLGATNPIDLMNRIRKSTSMDGATSPDSAVDQALRDFDARSQPGGSGAVKPPLAGP